jgi:glycosyltransferase involved in cell wall biosynthesis
MESTRRRLPARDRHTSQGFEGQGGHSELRKRMALSLVGRAARLRIAYIITRADEIGGAQVHVRDLASAMHAAGHEATVLAGMAGVLFDQLARRGVPFRRVPDLVRSIVPHRDFAAWRQLKALLKELRPDLVSTHSSKAGWLGRLAARALRIPVIFTAHGWAFTEGVPRPQRSVYALAERVMSPLADRIVTVSEYDRVLALQNRIAPPSKITRIHNGVHGCMGRLRPSAAAVRVVMIGRFSAQKDHASLLHALARLVQLDWTLDLVGDGPLQAQAIALAGSLGVTQRVRFLGACDDVCAVLKQADICALVSNWEGFPRSILEAMSVGLPLVASDVGGVSEAVREGETGFLVPRKDLRLLTNRLELLITRADLRHALGTVGRRRFNEEFQFELMFRRTVALYQQILAGDVRARR